MLDVTRLRVLDAVARHGTVTAAARALDYSQSSVSHHLARLEAETGAKLLQRAGRGVRLTQAGQLLAGRAAEIIGRLDAADAELAAHVGLTAGRVRLAGFASAIGALVLPAAAELAREHPGLEVSSIDTHPPEALTLLRTGRVEVALVFRYDDAEDELPGIRLRHLLDDPMHVIADRAVEGLADLRGATWVAGCPRCRGHLLALCEHAGFEPRIGFESDDIALIQSLVAAGLCVATLPGLALRAHHADGVVATRLPGLPRRVYAATYGEPPDPPAVAALLTALGTAAATAAG
ncbi:DNA-binding transcriptional LysR family regulator [Solirubrobacter pauli]|uniref:DNA-binding transcriptional LysR family regulator n=1 Tax=Solirubrobacter pauli TaxID=166793 RepID=A0A660L0Y6_9ACTN|nr:LysR family transcriptional regulator [Solirubrobacter pauli]RKQ86995.1 DNA-binding transcriptional LysR family regulator [Solirubrobacter pauli]